MSRVIFDLESDNLLDDLTRLHCLVLKDIDTLEVFSYTDDPNYPTRAGDLRAGLDRLSSCDWACGHNVVRFDIPAIQKVYPDWTPPKEIFDTLIACRLIWTDMRDRDFRNTSRNRYDLPKQLIGRHSLESWGYRLGLHKGSYGEGMDDPWAKWSPEMQEYCELDVEVTHKLYQTVLDKDYSTQALDLEHQFAELMFLQEQNGWPFDLDKARELYVTLQSRRIEIEKELQAIFPPREEEMKSPAYWESSSSGDRYPTKTAGKKAGCKDADLSRGPNKIKLHPFNPGSRDDIAARFIEKYQWKPKKFTDTKKVVVDETVLGKLPYPEAEVLNEYLMIQKRIGQLGDGPASWIKLERNRRIHGAVNSNGAVTGRCTHNSPNIANVPKASPDVPFGAECRSLFTAEPGWKLVGCDASGLELRCLAHFMGAYDHGDYGRMLIEEDIHTVNQQAAGLPTRDMAKTFIYGFLYGAGDVKIGSIVGKGRAAGAVLRERFLSSLPALATLKSTIESRVNERGYLIGLDGRHLHIRSQHAALNTLLQSAGAVAMKQSAVFFKQACDAKGLEHGKDYGFVGNIHDEVQITCPPEIAEDLGESFVSCIQAAGKHFNFRCPLDGEFKVGTNWSETH